MMNRIRVLFLVALTISIVAAVSVMAFALDIDPEDGEELYPSIVVKDDDVRVGEPVTIVVANVPSGSNVHWFVDHEYEYYGERVVHIFDRSDLMVIELEVYHGGRSGFARETIPVKCADFEVTTVHTYPFKQWAGNHGFTVEEIRARVNLPMTITQPTIVIEVEIEKATNDISCFCRVIGEKGSLSFEHQEFHGRYRDHSYRAVITPCHYEGFMDSISATECVVRCESGNCARIEFRIWVEF